MQAQKNKNDYVFTIGYQGDQAVSDKKLKAKYSRFTTQDFYQEGMYKQAVISALYEKKHGNTEELQQLIQALSQDFQDELSEEKLLRVFGIVQGIGETEHIGETEQGIGVQGKDEDSGNIQK